MCGSVVEIEVDLNEMNYYSPCRLVRTMWNLRERVREGFLGASSKAILVRFNPPNPTLYVLLVWSCGGGATAVNSLFCLCQLPVQIWTSQLKRTIQTAQYLDGKSEQFKALNELDVVRLPVEKK